MRPGVRLVQGLEIRDWAGGLEVGGQGFLGEEETREGPGAPGRTSGAGNAGNRVAWKMGPRPGSRETLNKLERALGPGKVETCFL